MQDAEEHLRDEMTDTAMRELSEAYLDMWEKIVAAHALTGPPQPPSGPDDG